MVEVLFTVAFMALIVGLAALILLIVDRVTLRRSFSKEECEAVVIARTERWQRRWNFFFFLMAFIALFVNAFNLGHESIVWRVCWFVLGAFVVLRYLGSRHDRG